MGKIKKLTFMLLLIILPCMVYAKTYYIITLKGGTKIKADSYMKENGFVKVFKFGGYIIYPEENIKNIKKITKEDVKVTTKQENKDNATAKVKNRCRPIVEKFEAIPVFSKEKQDFNLKVTGNINNNCPMDISQVKITIHFYNEENEELFTKVLNLNDISAYDNLKFEKIYNENNVGTIKYFNYKLEYVTE